MMFLSSPSRARLPRSPIIIPERVAKRAYERATVDENGCWISTYSVASHGYAQIGWQEGGGRWVVTAHRASWVHVHGQIPPGMTIDHTCRVRRCVNPDHLRLMSNVQNARDGGGHHKQKPVPTEAKCSRGHVVLSYSSGAKHCRECDHEWQRRKVARALLKRSGITPQTV